MAESSADLDHLLPTPVERAGPVWLKRDDLFEWQGGRGGKARMLQFLVAATGRPRGLVSCGSRLSEQAIVVARVAAGLGVPCRFHAPGGALGSILSRAQAAGATIVQHSPGWPSVVVARARRDAAEREWAWLPPGLESAEAVAATATQTVNVDFVSRVVVPVGSGTSLAGIVTGYLRHAQPMPELVGVVVGADPRARLDRIAPKEWPRHVTLVRAHEANFAKPAAVTTVGHVAVNAYYEAKCLDYLREGDALWCVGPP